MAQCIRFEIILPLRFRPRRSKIVISIEPEDFDPLFRHISRKYGGYTATDPRAPTPLIGSWHNEIENIITAFVLIPSGKSRQALKDFGKWKRDLEKKYNQEFILISYYSVNTIGDLLS